MVVCETLDRGILGDILTRDVRTLLLLQFAVDLGLSARR